MKGHKGRRMLLDLWRRYQLQDVVSKNKRASFKYNGKANEVDDYS